MGESRTWYLVRRVLQTPVRSIMATRRGMVVLVDMVAGEDVLVDGRRGGVCVLVWRIDLLWHCRSRAYSLLLRYHGDHLTVLP